MKKYVILITICLTLFSCNRSNNELYIPRDKFIAILTDMHLADAYYSTHYQLSRLHSDSVNFYNYIFENYGYNKKQFDTTLNYYAVHTKDFDLIYEEVVTALSKIEQENYMHRVAEPELIQNIWTGKNAWYLPQEGEKRKIPVNLKLKGKGKYTISFTCKIYPDDKSKNPHLYLYFAADSAKTEKRDSFGVKLYEKDARTSIISVSKDLKDSTFTHLRGFLMNHDEKTGRWKKHAVIEGLKVDYLPPSL